MAVPGLIAKKIDQKQTFLQDGRRIPVTVVSTVGNVVCQTKTVEHDGYNAVQLGFGTKKRTTKAIAGHIKKSGVTTMPRFFREFRIIEPSQIEIGAALAVADVFQLGDIVNVIGTSKGKGFAGGVKRHGFRGGPRTHGQSDRERAPGSIGQTTTPGRVYKGKRMAGNMGNDQVTVKNLEVVGIDGDMVMIKGLVPGPKGTILEIIKVRAGKKYMPLFTKADESLIAPVETVQEKVAELQKDAELQSDTVSEEVQTEVQSDKVAEVQSEVKEESQEEKAAAEEKKETK